eukprot:1554533-Pyramimonas_sp.AAC.1
MLQDLETNLDGEGKGLGQACDDFLGVVLFELAFIKIVLEVLQTMKLIARLSINISKCTAVPLAGSISEALRVEVRDLPGRYIPEWAEFVIEVCCILTSGSDLAPLLNGAGVTHPPMFAEEVACSASPAQQ